MDEVLLIQECLIGVVYPVNDTLYSGKEGEFETRQEGRIHVNFACEGFLGPYEAEVRDQFYRCHAGISVGSIRINGAISGCPSIRANYDQGNIYQDNFMEVWNNRFEKFPNGNGPVKANVPIVTCSVIVKEMACTYTMNPVS